MSSSHPLRIVHVFRAPLGGLFRHVVDLSVEQAARGHAVGLFFDSGGDGTRVRQAIARIPGGATLGVAVAPIRRNPHPGDVLAMRAFNRYLAAAKPDVVHGHGSKGGLYARLCGGRPIRAYTPHGGSFNYAPGSLLHAAYMRVERWLGRRTDVFLFESDHIREKYDAQVGLSRGVRRVVVNGLGAAEFVPCAPVEGAADFFYIGELRAAKGVDTLLDALAQVARETGTAPTVALVGSGPDRDALAARAQAHGLSGSVRFLGQRPMREALTLGRAMVAPSRQESMPYVVLEGAAARAPLITTRVGGIPEIFGPFADRLLPPDDPAALAEALIAERRRSPAERAAQAEDLAAYVRSRFSLDEMAETVLASYREALAVRAAGALSAKAGRANLVSEA